jgi:hypothetical protein
MEPGSGRVRQSQSLAAAGAASHDSKGRSGLAQKGGRIIAPSSGALSKRTGDGPGDKRPSAGAASRATDGGAAAGSGTLMGAKAGLLPYEKVGERFGMRVTSGLRPGAITASGNVSLHASGDAIDESGAPGNMLRYAKYMAAHYGSGLDELIHTPLGYGIKNGKRVPLSFWGAAINAQHQDHVHVGDRTPSGGGGGIGGGGGFSMAASGGGGRMGKVSLKAPKSQLGGAPGALSTAAGQLYAAGLTMKVNKAIAAGGGGRGGGVGPSAGGRRVGASMFGGPGDPGTGHIGYRGDDLNVHPDSFAELDMGHALGGLPYMAGLRVTGPRGSKMLYKRDIGAGGGPVNGVHRGIDLWYTAAQDLGINGLGVVKVEPAGGGGPSGDGIGWDGPVQWGGWNKNGGDFTVNKPTLFGAGEAGPERVQITPGGGSGMQINATVHVGGNKAHVQAIVEKHLQTFADLVHDEIHSGSEESAEGAMA